MAAAIEVDAVSKVFKLYQERRRSVKERVLKFGRSPYQIFHALDDVNLTVETGTTIGLLGHNGSGKSTLLKCMAGILQPTTGTVRTYGRLAALLELGAGFHPELTGRENVYLNGSILGMRKVEVDRVFDDIVAFSGLEQFIDSPVKHYSSGMYVRLGFAVAINVDPEILLVDEVLAVGDENFQRKCIDKVRSFQAEGRTIVVVTHAPDIVRQMCDRAVALEHGLLVAEGEPDDVIRAFRERLMAAAGAEMDPSIAKSEFSPLWHKVRIREVTIESTDADLEHVLLHPGEPLRLAVDLESDEAVDDIVVAVTIYTATGHLIYSTNTTHAGAPVGTVDGSLTVGFDFGDVPLMDGVYAVTVGVHTEHLVVCDSWEARRRFEMKAPDRGLGIVRCPPAITVGRAPSLPIARTGT